MMTAYPPSVKKGWRSGISRWLFTTHHQDLGRLYLLFSLVMLFVGGAMALLIRLELFQPGRQFFSPYLYDELVTVHGLVMVFGVIMPALVGLANGMIPLMIGAPDMAWPRWNQWSFWILVFAFFLLIFSLFLPGYRPHFGWTMYAPLSTVSALPRNNYLLVAIYLMSISWLFVAINIIVTVTNLRAPSMRWMRLPLFVWTWFITAFLWIAAMPVLVGVVTMALFDRHGGNGFFNAAYGGNLVFGFFSHPGVYLIILPALGIISQVIPTFARKKLFGYQSMVGALAAIAFLSYLGWGQHLFAARMAVNTQIYFMYAAMLMAVPTGMIVFNWVATLWKGCLTFETPLLFALAFVVLFTISEFSGLMLAVVSYDYLYQDTYFEVAHFHYVLVGGAFLGILSGVYYWLPKWTGRYYNETLGKWHFWLTMIGVNLAFFPMYFLGLAGMPRRIVDYALPYTTFNMAATIGAFILGLAQLVFLYNLITTLCGKGVSAYASVWEGAEGLEWASLRKNPDA